jgi:thiol-disulfide isomerase/thioredoxin
VRLAAALAAVLLLAGCGAAEAETSTWETPPATARATAVPASGAPAAVTVPTSLKFTGKTLDGQAFDASTLAGKPAILWFWAPWCATCASEAMSIADIAAEYQGRLGILGIAGMGNNKDMHEFVSDLEVGAVPHLDDQAGKLWKKFQITQQSWYVLLDRGGAITKTGYLDDLQLTAEVKRLVA